MNTWKRRGMWLGMMGAATLLAPQAWSPSTRAQSAARDGQGIANYDLRIDKGGPSRDEHVRDHHALSGADRLRVSSLAQGRDLAVARLADSLPALQVQESAELGTPEIVRIARRGGAARLVAVAGDASRGQMAKGFLADNGAVYGLTPEQVAALEETADYANPDGNLSWVTLVQRANGRRVFRGELSAAFDAEGALFQTTGQLAPDLDAAKLADQPAIGAAAAAERAAAAVGLAVPASEFMETAATEHQVTLRGGPFVQDVEAELVYFPLQPGVAALAWSMTLWEDFVAWTVVVDAEDGVLLFRKNLANQQTQSATYGVYNDDSPAPLSPTTNVDPSDAANAQGAIIGRTSFTLVSEHPSNNLGWMTDGASITTGNNVDAGLDLVSPNGIDAGSRPTGTGVRVFDYSYNPGPGSPPPGDSPTLADYRAGEVVSMFFWTNRYHDRLYELGFTEAARNFQQDNFGRGGLGNDFVRAEGQDFSGTSNANFATPPDGQLPRMQMYIFTGPTPDRTSALDQEILIHELTHGTSNRLHNNANGLNATMSGGMGEGWSDFYGRALLATADEDVNGIYAMGGYSTQEIVAGFGDNYYYGIRRFPYAVKTTVGPNGRPHNPLTFADIDPTQINLTDGAYPRGPIGSASAFAVHNIGEVWCMALLEVRARLITRMGFAAGNQRMLQLVTDGMKLDPANPTLIDGRNAILAASAASGGSAEEERDIWAGFATRGLGFSASAVSSSSSSVVEAFDLPNLQLGPVTILDDSLDHGGFADPGETVTLSVPLVNPLASTATGVTAEVVGAGGAQSYPDIGPGATEAQPFTVVIPADTPCGALLTYSVNVDSSLGPITHSFTLQVGAPTGQVPFEHGSGDVAVPIPEVGTAEVPILVTEEGIVGDVVVRLRLNHTFDGDLGISLIAPDGTTVPLSNNRGGAGDNFGTGNNDCSGTPTVFDDGAGTAIGAGTAPFAGSFRPDAPLAGFRGKSMAGTWRLRVVDGFAGDQGSIGCVQVRVERQLFYCFGVAGTPVIEAAPPAVLTAESAEPPNGAPDPDETVTFSFPLRNVGTAITGNLVATLLPTGGINAPSPPQSYGMVSPIGPAEARAFTFVPSGDCGESITATLQLQDGALDLGTVTFTMQLGTTLHTPQPPVGNPAAITIPATGTGTATGAPATPYPSTIAVTGLGGVVSKVTVDLFGLSHTFPGDVDVLLVGPGGQRMILMSDAGGGTDVTGINLTFDDAAGAALPATLVSGTFRPTNVGTGDLFPAPAPAAPFGAALSAFNGTDPNGTWSLFVVDDAGVDVGSVAGGWTLNLTTAAPVCVTSPCTLHVPDDVVQGNDPGLCGAVVTFPPTGVTGSCGVVTTSPPSGSFFPVGPTVVTSTGTRQDGTTTTATFNVTVNDVEGPTLSLPVANPSLLWPPNHKLVPVQVSYGATDNCTAVGAIAESVSVTSDEPVNGNGDGNTSPDWIVDGPHAVRLRAERAGGGDGRTYTIACTVIDQYGNSTTKTVPVVVPHDR
ncbi:MAG TPA: M36 family metallopeptidase [Vicinamibacteria bacterium]